MPCSRSGSSTPTGTMASNTTPRRRPASGSVFCGSWRRTASRWWPRTCRFRPSATWRSPATSFVGYRAPGSTDRLLDWGRTRRPHAFEQLVDRYLVRYRPYLRRLRLWLLYRKQVDHLAPHRLVLRQHARVGALLGIDPAFQAVRHGRDVGCPHAVFASPSDRPLGALVRCICSRQQVAQSVIRPDHHWHAWNRRYSRHGVRRLAPVDEDSP